MAEHVIPEIDVIDCRELRQFIDELKRRKNIRLVKVNDEGSIEPSRRGTTIVMQPRVRVVATAYDSKSHNIIKWEQRWDIGPGMVTTDASEGRGQLRNGIGIRTKQDVIDELEVEQYQVASGEWTAETIHDILARRVR